MSVDRNRQIGVRLRAARKHRRMTVAAVAEAFRELASQRDRRRLPKHADLCRTIRGHEAGEHPPGPNYRMLYAAAYDRSEAELFADEQPATLGLVDAAPLPGGNGRPVDDDFVRAVRQTSQDLVGLDTRYGADDLFPLARRVFRSASHRLGRGEFAPGIERDFMAAAGEAGEVAAWLAYDADRQAASRQLIHEALFLSRQAGDRDMQLFELSHLAMHAHFLHRPAEALRIACDVLDGGNLPPRVAALFDIRRGRALAQLNDAGRAFDALDRARSTLAQGISPRDPYWTWWLTDAEVAWQRGIAHAELGQWRAAIPYLQESAERRSAYRRARYNDLAHLLNVLVRVRAWTEAEPVLTAVLDLIGDVGSGRTTNLLRRVAVRIHRAEAVPPSFRDAADELRHLLSEESGAGPHSVRS